MSLISKNRTAKEILENKDFRHSYVWEHIKRSIPFQIRTMRTEREWSQSKAGEILGKPQNVISRLESPAYGKLTLQTLLDIASGFDVGLIIKFVPFSRFLREYDDVSFDALSSPSPTDSSEIQAIWNWATNGHTGSNLKDKNDSTTPQLNRRRQTANPRQGRLFLDKASVLQGNYSTKTQHHAETEGLEKYVSGEQTAKPSFEQILASQGGQTLDKAAA